MKRRHHQPLPAGSGLYVYRDVQGHWRDQTILILAMLVALPFCQKRRDFSR